MDRRHIPLVQGSPNTKYQHKAKIVFQELTRTWGPLRQLDGSGDHLCCFRNSLGPLMITMSTVDSVEKRVHAYTHSYCVIYFTLTLIGQSSRLMIFQKLHLTGPLVGSGSIDHPLPRPYDLLLARGRIIREQDPLFASSR